MKLFVAVAVACLTIAPGVAENSGTIIGRWRSAETSKGGIGAMYEFSADGTVLFSPGAIVEMPFRLENSFLIFPPATQNGPETRSVLTWEGENQFRMSTQGQDGGIFRRVGRRSGTQNPLEGEWIGTREMAGKRLEARMIFDAGTKMLLLIKFTTQQGRYSVTNGRLVAAFNGQVGMDGTVEIANGISSVQRSGGRVTKLVRY